MSCILLLFLKSKRGFRLIDGKTGNTRFLAVIVVGLLVTLGTHIARAQSGANIHAGAEAQAAIAVTANGLDAQEKAKAAADEGELQLVVALFRHGIRAPLKGFYDNAGKHSESPWPDLEKDWHVGPPQDGYGQLTPQGVQAAKTLGRYYADYYRKGAWSKGFTAYLWADSADQRTRATARALTDGLRTPGIAAKWDSLKPDGTLDLLFHPFKAKCGKPDPIKLGNIAKDINDNWFSWRNQRKTEFAELDKVLATDKSKAPLNTVNDVAIVCRDDEKTICKDAGAACQSPISWCGRIGTTPYQGQFPYASSASEAFLLEYATNMPSANVGWNRVPVPAPKTGPWNLRTMLQLHEFYFDQTERKLSAGEPYLARIAGSNLIREILATLGKQTGGCQHGPPENQFVGLVGHDTNLANVGALLGLRWQFDDKSLPPDTLGLPANDALPAGALVFELRRLSDGRNFVKIEYVAQSLSQMRNNGPGAFRLNVSCTDTKGRRLAVCNLPLEEFTELVQKAYGKCEFLSTCVKGKPPTCPP
jgi:4-phytase / acid phosphatase